MADKINICFCTSFKFLIHVYKQFFYYKNIDYCSLFIQR